MMKELISSTLESSNVTQVSAASSFECQPQSSTWAFGWMFIPVLEVLLNSFFIFVTYRSKRKLRHNYVYAYVINVFMGNLFLGVVTLYSLFNFIFVFERYWGSPNPFKVDDSSNSKSLQLWWSFQRAFSLSVYLTNNANVSALIYGIRDSSYFVGRNASASKRNSDKMVDPRKRKRRALIIIAFTWLLPLAFTFAGLFSNCIDHCLCVYANYGPSVNYCQTDVNKECSRIWMPLTHKLLLAIAVTWCAEMVFIIFMLASAVRHAKEAMKPQSTIRSSSCNESPSDHMLSTMMSQSPSYSSSASESVSPTQPNYSKKIQVKSVQKSRFCNTTLKFLFVISTTFFLTSLPVMVVIFIDVISHDFIILQYSVTAVLAISFLYPLLVPIILVYYMPSLRSATHHLIFSLECCTRTTMKIENPIKASKYNLKTIT